MSKRVGLIRRSAFAGVDNAEEPSEAGALASDVHELDSAPEIALPREHPRWARDRFTVSAATKALVDRIAPFALCFNRDTIATLARKSGRRPLHEFLGTPN